ncbi:hypothetical protein BKA93DRAFT_299801 [Sparassis latifolia]
MTLVTLSHFSALTLDKPGLRQSASTNHSPSSYLGCTHCVFEALCLSDQEFNSASCSCLLSKTTISGSVAALPFTVTDIKRLSKDFLSARTSLRTACLSGKGNSVQSTRLQSTPKHNRPFMNFMPVSHLPYTEIKLHYRGSEHMAATSTGSPRGRSSAEAECLRGEAVRLMGSAMADN